MKNHLETREKGGSQFWTLQKRRKIVQGFEEERVKV